MNKEQLMEHLLENPFDCKARSELASVFFNEGQWNKAHQQYSLIEKQRPLENIEQVLMKQCATHSQISEEPEQKSRDQITPEEVVSEVTSEPQNTSPNLTVISGGQNETPSPADDNVVSIHHLSEEITRFNDIAGLEAVKKTLKLQIIEPFKNPEIFKKFGKKAGGGVLLYGPPGCGKTMLARAVANECNATFIPVAISDILDKYVGESEANLRLIFEKARYSTPTVLFFDELDALAYARGKSQSDYSRTLVNEFLNQLDGMGHDNSDILFLAASNMPWDIDSAMKRPGRFSRQIFIPPPDETARAYLLEHKLEKLPLAKIDLKKINQQLTNFSGADIDGLVEVLRELTVERYIESGQEQALTMKDFNQVLKSVNSSTNDWLTTARNVVKYAGSDKTYQGVELYLKANKLM